MAAAASSESFNHFNVYHDSSVSPHSSPVLRGKLEHQGALRGSKENLFMEEDTPPPPPQSTGHSPGEKKRKKKHLLKKSKSEKKERQDSTQSADHESTGSPPPQSPPSEGGVARKEEKRKKKEKRYALEQLERELALSKTQCADYANQLEQKVLELKQAVQREAFLIRELKEIRLHAGELEQKVHLFVFYGTCMCVGAGLSWWH